MKLIKKDEDPVTKNAAENLDDDEKAVNDNHNDNDGQANSVDQD